MHRASYRFMLPCSITETLSDVESVRVVHENAHGRFEYVPIQYMVKNVEILLNICESALAIADNA